MTDLSRSTTLTTVFTDIEGSTELLRRLGNETYLEEVELHRALLRAAFARRGGREVEVEGELSHFVFPSAAGAVVAAAEAQRALSEARWPRGEPIRVRIGIHTHEPAVPGDLSAGLDFLRAARVMAAGHGGQVLLSETAALAILSETKDEELPRELAIRDLGNRLYQVGSEEFPPLRD